MPWEGVLSYDATYLNNQVAAHCSYGDYHVLFFFMSALSGNGALCMYVTAM